MVEAERKQAEKQLVTIESEQTRKRLRALEKAAAKFMSENREQDELTRTDQEVITESIFEQKGFILSPPFTQIVVGHSSHFWLSIKQEAFPEIALGDSVAIDCVTDDISTSKRSCALEAHPTRQGVIRGVWTAKGEKVSPATALRARVGAIVAESTIEVFASESDKYSFVKAFTFNHKRYSVQVGAKRTIVLLAPCPSTVFRPTPVQIECQDKGFLISGSLLLVPRPHLGIAECRLKVSAQRPNLSSKLIANIPGYSCEADIVSVEALGASIKIDLKDIDLKNQRYFWRENILEIAARHPSIKRYLGPPPGFPGQEEKHFRLLLAEIVADAVCARIVSRNELSKPEEYGDYDWDAYYAEYSALLTRFLPIAHDTQV